MNRLAAGLLMFLMSQAMAFAQDDKYAVIISTLGAETPYDSLTQAVAAVQSGDTIRLYPGIHPVMPGYTFYADGVSSAPMQLREKTNVTIVGLGNNVVVQGDGPGDFLLIRDCRDIVLENLTFRGNKPEVEGPLFATVDFSGTNSNIRISKCSFLDQGNHAISHLWGDKTTRGVEVSQCLFVNGGDIDGRGGDSDGAAVSGIGSDWLVVNNRVESWVRGFEIENSGTSIIENVNITGNIISDTRNIGIMIFTTSGDASRFLNILISGNQIRDTYSRACPIFVGGGENITVSRNLVNGAGAAGIYFLTSHGDIRNCIVAHNQVENAGWRGIQVYQQSPHVCENVLIDGNYVANSDNSGILARGKNFTIVNNILQNNSRTDIGAGIKLDAGTDGAMVMGNRCWDGGSTMCQDYGIWLQSGVSNTMLRDNWLVDNLTANLQDDSVGSDSFGNRISAAADETRVEINTAGGRIALTWPRSSLSYTVQTASNKLPLVWIDATNSVSVVDDKNFAVVPMHYKGILYRLHGQ